MDTLLMRKEIAIALGWFAAVSTAAVVGITTIGGLSTSAPEDPPLTQQDIDQALVTPGGQPTPSGSAAAPRATPTAPTTATPTSTGRKYVSTAGGTLWASCTGTLAKLDSVTPKQGYRVDGKVLGPATTVWVNFKLDVRRGHAAEYEVTVSCAGGVPLEHIEFEE